MSKQTINSRIEKIWKNKVTGKMGFMRLNRI
jgi:hypothetical protein